MKELFKKLYQWLLSRFRKPVEVQKPPQEPVGGPVVDSKPPVATPLPIPQPETPVDNRSEYEKYVEFYNKLPVNMLAYYPSPADWAYRQQLVADFNSKLPGVEPGYIEFSGKGSQVFLQKVQHNADGTVEIDIVPHRQNPQGITYWVMDESGKTVIAASYSVNAYANIRFPVEAGKVYFLNVKLQDDGGILVHTFIR